MSVSGSYYSPDRGCQVSARCVNCPLSACKLDNPGPFRVWLQMKGRPNLVPNIRAAEREAERLGVTVRTVYRRLEKLRA